MTCRVWLRASSEVAVLGKLATASLNFLLEIVIERTRLTETARGASTVSAHELNNSKSRNDNKCENKT